MAVIEFQDPARDIVEKVAIMGHGNDRALVTREVLLEPVDRVGVKVVGRLVEKQDGRLLQQQPRERDAAALAAGKRVDNRLARRTAQRVHRLLHHRRHIPRTEAVDFLLKLRLFVGNRILRLVVGGIGEFVPTGVVRCGEIGEVLHALLDARAHRGAGRERGLLRQEADRVTRLEVHAAVDVGVDAREDAHERGLAGTVEAEDADLRAVVERQRDVAEDFLALDLLRDAEHREDDLGGFGGCHGRS